MLFAPSNVAMTSMPERHALVLLQQRVLPEDLDRAIAGAVDADLRARAQPVAQLEADLRARVEAEEVGQQIAEIAAAERTREAVRHAERDLVLRQAQRRRQRGEIEVGLQRIEPDVGIRCLRWLCGGRSSRIWQPARIGRRRCLCDELDRRPGPSRAGQR